MKNIVKRIVNSIGYKISKKYKCKYIVEIRDLWPESIFINKPNISKLLIKPFYNIEKWFYKKADRIIFTMEGGVDYIKEKGWEKEIRLEKVYYINNGVDLETFNYNRDHYQIDDEDLFNEDLFKVVFTGSIREAYNIPFLIKTGMLLKEAGENGIKILIYGKVQLLQGFKNKGAHENKSFEQTGSIADFWLRP